MSQSQARYHEQVDPSSGLVYHEVTQEELSQGHYLAWIVSKYLGSYMLVGNYRWNPQAYEMIAKINGLSSPDVIHAGQWIYLETDNGRLDGKTPNHSGEGYVYEGDNVVYTTQVKIQYFGLLGHSETEASVESNELLCDWSWVKDNTDSFEYVWLYTNGLRYPNGELIWMIGNSGSVPYTEPVFQSTYTIPDGATIVKFRVKPVSQQKQSSSYNTAPIYYWTGEYCPDQVHDVSTNPPKPIDGAPEIEIDDELKLTATVGNLPTDLNATNIEFQIWKVGHEFVSEIGIVPYNTDTRYASYSCYVESGYSYAVRVRTSRDGLYSAWGEWDSVTGTPTVPKTPETLTAKAETKSVIFLEWSASETADSYDIEYATKLENFDVTGDTSSITVNDRTNWRLTGLNTGYVYYFRIRATNDAGSSEWSDILASVSLGEAPNAPSTWSSTTTAKTSEPVILYWTHNSKDGSVQKVAEIEMTDSTHTWTATVTFSEDDPDADRKSYYEFDTSGYSAGESITWKVRTKGIDIYHDVNDFSEWSVTRTFDIYAEPIVTASVCEYAGSPISTVTSFPFFITAVSGPVSSNQRPLFYTLDILAMSSYTTTDERGDFVFVREGETIFSKTYDIYEDAVDTSILVMMSADNISLYNNVRYALNCTVTMDSGLTAQLANPIGFLVAWDTMEYAPNAEIQINQDNFTASIGPYCKDYNGELVSDVELAVYRREYDNTLTKIADKIQNGMNIFVTDPHPTLTLARYRVVAKSNTTGVVSYYDIPGYPVDCPYIILQWGEEWSSYDGEIVSERASYGGSTLVLPYNIDITDDNSRESVQVSYAGRRYPVMFYGEKVNSSSTWNTEIPKTDQETIYALRRLAIWQGDVYVREPSGSGYLANVKVSFSISHDSVTIPVTLSVLRVENTGA